MRIASFCSLASTRRDASCTDVRLRRLGHICSCQSSYRTSPKALCWVHQQEDSVFQLPARAHDLVTRFSAGMVSNEEPAIGAAGGPDAIPVGLEDPSKLPRHIAIIMDGNRRWAKQQGLLSCLKGHEAGLESLKTVAKRCQERGVQALTVFAFSSENWNRGRTEVDGLMLLLESTFKSNVEDLVAEGMRFTFFGELEKLPISVQNCVSSLEERTADNPGLTCSVALSYGGKQDIVQAAQHAARLVADGKLKPEDLSEDLFQSLLLTKGILDASGPPDLLIRTSGEMRISNFMLWDLAYAELYFSEKLWPEFSGRDLDDALLAYTSRSRRFGGGNGAGSGTLKPKASRADAAAAQQ